VTLSAVDFRLRVSFLIHKYNLSKDLNILDEEDGWKKEGYWYLVFALHGLDTLMDPDYAWYQKRVFFDNGYGASIICKPFSYGGDAKKFEIAVLKFGKICYDTPVSYDVEGYLDFYDVIEILHEIHNLPPAEKDDAVKSKPLDAIERWNQTKKRIKRNEKENKETDEKSVETTDIRDTKPGRQNARNGNSSLKRKRRKRNLMNPNKNQNNKKQCHRTRTLCRPGRPQL